jgi:hypothetical protein
MYITDYVLFASWMLMLALSCTDDADATLIVVLLFHILQLVKLHVPRVTNLYLLLFYFSAFSCIDVYKIMVSMHGFCHSL